MAQEGHFGESLGCPQSNRLGGPNKGRRSPKGLTVGRRVLGRIGLQNDCSELKKNLLVVSL